MQKNGRSTGREKKVYDNRISSNREELVYKSLRVSFSSKLSRLKLFRIVILCFNTHLEKIPYYSSTVAGSF